MAAMYLGSVLGATLAARIGAADLAAWALVPAVLALVLTEWIATRTAARKTPSSAQADVCSVA
ncbi:hypothetical protein [Phytoactinopolyspora endophytica]|uniref:hypothetical protein n=1 Tax=Phytoactinopolyspora endophytica TaxID=1642495 RepID=UPI00197B2B5D|nr:hypothetical protein [Phytoactinopolyspora endophytica]